MEVPPVRLEGRLVVLEPLAESHAEGLWRAAQDPEVWRWTHADVGASRAAFDRWLEDALAEARSGVSLPFAQLGTGGEPLGSTRYMSIRPEHRGLEIGHTWLSSRAWGTGVNAEAKLLLLRHAFEELGAMRVEFKTDAKNERSRAALAALPARFEGVFAKHMLVRDGAVRDSAWYAVTDDEWPAVRAALEARVARFLDG
ncbi:MAG TPA: GNAT family N-acetyltransferase [Gaiellaceae bacterium]|nr:GNAT family N-acetyltransferase [Gaiellaceae bacterium]